MAAVPAGVPAAFYWERTPAYAAPPAVAELQQRIAKLAEFAARNGPSFIELIKTKQKDNSEYAFLFGGEGSDYFTWVLYCAQYQLPPDQPPPTAVSSAFQHAPQQPAVAATACATSGAGHGYPAATVPQPATAAAPELPAEVDSGWTQVLGMLTGSKESIRSSQEWFFACEPYAAGMAHKLAQHMKQQPSYERQLHVLYLANDILLKGLAKRAGGAGEQDPIAEAFRPVLAGMLGSAYAGGQQAAEVKERLTQIISFWQERGLYGPETIGGLRVAMLSANPRAVLPGATPQVPVVSQQWSAAAAAPPAAYPHTSPSAAYPHQPPQQPGYPPATIDPWQQQQQQQQQQPYPPAANAPPAWGGSQYPPQSATPPGVAPQYAAPPPQPGAWGYQGLPPGVGAYPPPGVGLPYQHPALAPPPDLAPPPAPVDPMSFPPGLLPQLVEEKLRLEAPYSPLSPLDVEQAGLPPPGDVDPYLRSRLDRFYAELQDYRPGMTRADMEDAERRARRREGAEDSGTAGSRRASRWSGSEDAAPRHRASEPAPSADGSFRSGLGSGNVGLGFAEQQVTARPSQAGAAYDTYRQMRASRYHESLSKAAAAKMGG